MWSSNDNDEDVIREQSMFDVYGNKEDSFSSSPMIMNRNPSLGEDHAEEGKKEVEQTPSFRKTMGDALPSFKMPSFRKSKSEATQMKIKSVSDEATAGLDSLENLAASSAKLKTFICCFMQINFDVSWTPANHHQSFNTALVVLLCFQVLMFFLFGFYVDDNYIDHFVTVYNMFTGIEIMMFFGFGYLMTFLKRYGMGAVGFTMLITVIGIQWGVLVEAFFNKLYYKDFHHDTVKLDVIVVMDALFLVAAVLISYGAIIGKVNPLQIVILTLIEAVFYSLNKVVLLFGVVDLVDAGGTVNIHMFGCYFGLAVAYMLGKPKASTDSEGGHISDLFSLIGTIFLWIYWPSFNGGALEANSPQQERAVVNTILGLCASTVATFWTSIALSSDWKIRPVDIQNATLSGGVALGVICHFTLGLADVLLVGVAAGVASSLGFARLQPYLDNKGLHDTCGVNNLHGIPSLIGAIASIILAAYKGPRGHDYPDVLVHRGQWKDQLLSTIFTLAVAILGGLATGWFLRLFSYDTTFYSDEPFWEVMDDFGRSQEEAVKDNMEDIEAGLKASKMLRRIIGEYAKLGFKEDSKHEAESSSRSSGAGAIDPNKRKSA